MLVSRDSSLKKKPKQVCYWQINTKFLFSTYEKSHLSFNLSLEVNFHIKLEVQDHRSVVNLIMGCHSPLPMYAIKEKSVFFFCFQLDAQYWEKQKINIKLLWSQMNRCTFCSLYLAINPERAVGSRQTGSVPPTALVQVSEIRTGHQQHLLYEYVRKMFPGCTIHAGLWRQFLLQLPFSRGQISTCHQTTGVFWWFFLLLLVLWFCCCCFILALTTAAL